MPIELRTLGCGALRGKAIIDICVMGSRARGNADEIWRELRDTFACV